jgi:hypothetical protein
MVLTREIARRIWIISKRNLTYFTTPKSDREKDDLLGELKPY